MPRIQKMEIGIRSRFSQGKKLISKALQGPVLRLIISSIFVNEAFLGKCDSVY